MQYFFYEAFDTSLKTQLIIFFLFFIIFESTSNYYLLKIRRKRITENNRELHYPIQREFILVYIHIFNTYYINNIISRF